MAHFSLDEARALMPQVKQLTAAAYDRVETIVAEAKELGPEEPETQRLAKLANEVVRKWVASIVELGAEAKGLWLVDFDTGSGYWCWRHPEESLEYYHTYEAGFAGRELIEPEVLH